MQPCKHGPPVEEATRSHSIKEQSPTFQRPLALHEAGNDVERLGQVRAIRTLRSIHSRQTRQCAQAGDLGGEAHKHRTRVAFGRKGAWGLQFREEGVRM